MGERFNKFKNSIWKILTNLKFTFSPTVKNTIVKGSDMKKCNVINGVITFITVLALLVVVVFIPPKEIHTIEYRDKIIEVEVIKEVETIKYVDKIIEVPIEIIKEKIIYIDKIINVCEIKKKKCPTGDSEDELNCGYGND